MITITSHTSLRELLQKLNEWHNPSLGEISFKAIYIEDAWTFDELGVALPLVMATMLGIVLACKFVYGDWGIAWNVGCFFATLAAIPLRTRHRGADKP